MADVTFTENIQRHVACPPCRVTSRNVRKVLEAVFAENERARSQENSRQRLAANLPPVYCVRSERHPAWDKT